MKEISYVNSFITNPDELFNSLKTELVWVHRDATPRMEYYVNSVNVPYTYGSKFPRTYEPQNDHFAIKTIRDAVEKFLDTKFEVCFLNRYLNQSDHLGWHADDSPEMDDDRPIAIISLGVEREIWFRQNESDEIIKQKLAHGSLCVMSKGMQDTHKHRIPKAGFMCGERISLTFRGYKGL